MIQTLMALLISLNISGEARSSECRTSGSEGGVQTCVEEFNATIKNVGEAPLPCVTLENEKKPFPKLSEEFKNKSDACLNFITSNGDTGTFGPWGEAIVNYLDDKGNDSIFFSADLTGMSSGVAACPNWKEMSGDEKKHFWVWVMASISTIESRCNPNARNGASTNGVAVGLVQLDERHSQRSWRGQNCKVRSVTNSKDNLRCGMDILGELLKGQRGEYKGNGELWGKKSSSYWQHLRLKDGGGISDLIQLNPYCKK